MADEQGETASLSELREEYKPHRESAGKILESAGIDPQSQEFRKARGKIAKEFAEKEREGLIDELTGLYNKRGFSKRLGEEIEFAKRYSNQLHIAMIDANDLKKLNDSAGHLQGDELIQDVANFLKKTSRKEDTVARVGGDEYRVILRGTDIEGLSAWARRMTSNFNTTSISVSIGGAEVNLENPEESLRESDENMYSAKELAKNAGGSFYVDKTIKHG